MNYRNLILVGIFLPQLMLCKTSSNIQEAKKKPIIIEHSAIPAFKNPNATLQGLATRSMGAGQFEVWQSRVKPGGKTPVHYHSSEEVFIFLEGGGTAVVDGKEFHFKAPATVILPAGVSHQFKNTLKVESRAIVIVGINSKVHSYDHKELDLPWRK